MRCIKPWKNVKKIFKIRRTDSLWNLASNYALNSLIWKCADLCSHLPLPSPLPFENRTNLRTRDRSRKTERRLSVCFCCWFSCNLFSVLFVRKEEETYVEVALVCISLISFQITSTLSSFKQTPSWQSFIIHRTSYVSYVECASIPSSSYENR